MIDFREGVGEGVVNQTLSGTLKRLDLCGIYVHKVVSVFPLGFSLPTFLDDLRGSRGTSNTVQTLYRVKDRVN